MRDQRLVGRGHRIVPQPVSSDPDKFLSFARVHDAVPSAANVKRHKQMEIVIGVAGEGERGKACRFHFYVQLLLELPDQARLWRLADFDLAAGKFPQACHRLACRPLRKQHAPIRIDEGAGGDENEIQASVSSDTIR
jgi:hypothetical protein